jgi:exosortase/archaeosortase family protein
MGRRQHGKSTKANVRGAAASATERVEGDSAFRVWYRSKRPVVLFVAGFALLMAIFYGVLWIPYMNETVMPSYMRLNAVAAAKVMNVFGANARTNGTQISASSPRAWSVDIQQGCDAIEPTALFVAAVLAFPACVRFKLPGVVIGAISLALINLVRIITLFYTGIYFPRAFEIMHVDVWQPIFILLALTFWIFWAWWATKPRPEPSHAA